MRDIHDWTGPKIFLIEIESADADGDDARARVRSLHLCADGEWSWIDRADWYRRFRYSDEAERGYPSDENLFTAGEFKTELGSSPVRLRLAREIEVFPETGLVEKSPRPAVEDFVLKYPAGIVAGFPWFGEWGRDTFIALPGVAQGLLEAGGDPGDVQGWSAEVFARWGQWIHVSGMLPNLIEEEGSHQWESADATLWWCHAAAAVWMMSLHPQSSFAGIEKRLTPTLSAAISSIRAGSHLFLREQEDGLLEVTEPHTTWMDARIDLIPVTPRTGALPEINALWFQARCLQALWANAGKGLSRTAMSELTELGRRCLRLAETETERPNSVFLHSVPLAPFFVLGKIAPEVAREENADFLRLRERFLTPVGLRTLSPADSKYHSRCVGTQRERDLAYHQGPAWGWLGGHYEMAKDRLRDRLKAEGRAREMPTFPEPDLDEALSEMVMKSMPIENHIAELFDAEPPYSARGAPAQAWSLACRIEARARKRLGSDARLTEILARRWLDRRQRPARSRPQVRANDEETA